MNDEAPIPRQRDFGAQPLVALMAHHDLKAADLIAASPTQLTHKMISRACKGRWLTPQSRRKMRAALIGACGKDYKMKELFNYVVARGE